MEAKTSLMERLGTVNDKLLSLEQRISRGEELPVSETLDEATVLVEEILRAFLDDEGREYSPDDHILELWKRLVKGEPALNTIRDNCRELVYYRNCLDMQREDALPPHPARMAVRTARHIYLYMRSRAEQRGMLQED